MLARWLPNWFGKKATPSEKTTTEQATETSIQEIPQIIQRKESEIKQEEKVTPPSTKISAQPPVTADIQQEQPSPPKITPQKAQPRAEEKYIPQKMAVDTEAKNVLYQSFDFDGCLAAKFFFRLYAKFPKFNQWSNEAKIKYIQDHQEEIAAEILADNDALFQKIAEDIVKYGYDKVVLMLGSNRQSLYRDLINAIDGAGSAFIILERIPGIIRKKVAALAPELKCNIIYDDSTLAGTFSTAVKPSESKTGGSSMGHDASKKEFQKDAPRLHDTLIDIEFKLKNHSRTDAEWLFDQTKISLLYHQMQRARALNPNAIINFHFYDDKHDGILLPLYQFFRDNPELMPKNVNLYLHHYNGDLQESKRPLPGSGDPDPHYKDTLIALGARILTNRQVWSETQRNLVTVIWVPDYCKLNFSADDEKAHPDEEIKTRLTAAKEFVENTAKHGQAIGLQGAPDTAGSFTYTADDFKHARKFAERANPTAKLAQTNHTVKAPTWFIDNQAAQNDKPASTNEPAPRRAFV